MSFFSQNTKKAAVNNSSGTHLRKDVGFGEAFTASRLNAYGIAEEGAIIAREKKELRGWLREQVGDRFTSQKSMHETPELYHDELKAAKQLESEGIELPERFRHNTPEEFSALAIEREAVKFKERSTKLERARGSGQMGALIGGVVGAFDDPENLLTMPLGASGRAGIAATALIEGGIGATMEAATHFPRKNLLGKMGVDDDSTLLQSVLTGFVGGAVLGGAVRTLTGPEVYRAGGQVIGKIGLRRTAKALQKTDNPTARVQGHAIEDELQYKEQFKAKAERAVRDADPDLELDAEFLRDFVNFDKQAANVRASIDAGQMTVPIRLSDDVHIQVEAAENIVRAANLLQRYDIGEVIPLDEVENLGIDLGVSHTHRNVIRYYDDMDARFRGQNIPDEFDPIEDFDAAGAPVSDDVVIPLDRTEDLRDTIAERQARMGSRQARIDRLKEEAATPADFDGNLTRAARFDGASSAERATLEADQRTEYQGIIRDVERVAIGTKDGGLDAVEANKIIQELAADEEFAEQIKLCGLQ